MLLRRALVSRSLPKGEMVLRMSPIAGRNRLVGAVFADACSPEGHLSGNREDTPVDDVAILERRGRADWIARKLGQPRLCGFG